MFQLGNKSYVVAYRQTALTNGATGTSDAIDTKPSGVAYEEAVILIHGSTSNNATNKPATLRITESDDTVASNFAAITALTGGTASGNFTIPNSPTATTTAPYAVFELDLRGRKRYLTVEISPVTTQTFSVLAQLGRASQSPTTVAAQNAAVVVRG